MSLTFAQRSMTPIIFRFSSHSMAAVSRQVTLAPHVCAHVRRLCFTTWLRDKSSLKTAKCRLTSVGELLKVKRWINLIQSFWQNPLKIWCSVLYLVKSSMFVAVKMPSASHKSHPKHHEWQVIDANGSKGELYWIKRCGTQTLELSNTKLTWWAAATQRSCPDTLPWWWQLHPDAQNVVEKSRPPHQCRRSWVFLLAFLFMALVSFQLKGCFFSTIYL